MGVEEVAMKARTVRGEGICLTNFVIFKEWRNED